MRSPLETVSEWSDSSAVSRLNRSKRRKLETETTPALTLKSSPALTLIPSPASATTRPPDTTRADDTDDTDNESPDRSHIPPADTLKPSDTYPCTAPDARKTPSPVDKPANESETVSSGDSMLSVSARKLISPPDAASTSPSTLTLSRPVLTPNDDPACTASDDDAPITPLPTYASALPGARITASSVVSDTPPADTPSRRPSDSTPIEPPVTRTSSPPYASKRLPATTLTSRLLTSIDTDDDTLTSEPLTCTPSTDDTSTLPPAFTTTSIELTLTSSPADASIRHADDTDTEPDERRPK